MLYQPPAEDEQAMERLCGPESARIELSAKSATLRRLSRHRMRREVSTRSRHRPEGHGSFRSTRSPLRSNHSSSRETSRRPQCP